MRTRLPIAALPLLILPAAAYSQDAQRGRDLYMNAARVKQTPVESCVSCHGLPPDRKLWGQSPTSLSGAFSSVVAMAGFTAALTPQDVTDLSAYLRDPRDVPTPLPALDPLGVVMAAAPGTSSPSLQMTLANNGDLSLRLAANPVALGPTAAGFAVRDTTCGAGQILAPGTACVTTIVFAPAQTQPTSAQLGFSFETIAAPLTISLQGQPRAAGALTQSVVGISFGPTLAQTSTTPRQITLTNSGSQSLQVSSFVLAGPAATDFASQGCAPGVQLDPGASCTVQVSFRPAAAGGRQATLIIEAANAIAPAVITLTGEGIGQPAPPSPAPPPPSPQPPPPTPPAPGGAGPTGGGGAAVWWLLLLAGCSVRLRKSATSLPDSTHARIDRVPP
jgi:hypothetical protein